MENSGLPKLNAELSSVYTSLQVTQPMRPQDYVVKNRVPGV